MDRQILKNHSNPFKSHTSISYSLPSGGQVKLVLYNSLGSRMDILVNEPGTADIHTITWDAGDLPAGLYILKLEGNGFVVSSKLYLIE